VTPCIFHVDLDAFFVSVEQLYEPSLKGKAVIVGGHPDSRGVVSAASYEARRFGVRSAMPLSQARRLCPQAVFLPVNFPRYVDASRRFMKLLARAGSTVEALGLDEAYMDMTALVQDSDGAYEQAVELKQRIRSEIGLVASIGVATCKVVAKVASDFDKPDGLVLVRPGDEAAFLAPLEIRKLPGVGKRTEASLLEIGVQTIGQLASLPPEVVQRRLGSFGEALLRHARGIDDSAVEPRGEPKSMSREVTFSRDTRDVSALESTLQTMCVELSHDLRHHQKRARTVTIKLRYEDFKTVTRQVSLPVETAETGDLFAAAVAMLHGQLTGERRCIRLIGVRATRLSGPERQLDMFAQDSVRIWNLERAVAEIRARYGTEAIQTLGQSGEKTGDRHE